MGARGELPAGHHALTAVSQSGLSHSAFYLGVRLIPEPSNGQAILRWNFTVAPIDGSTTGPVEWQHAYADAVEPSVLEKWVLLVGVYDLTSRCARLYVPGSDVVGIARLPENWPCWNAENGLHVGCGRYLDGVADQWPGSVGPVRAFAGVLSADDAASLYSRDAIAGK
jgi:hypothetical protein